MSRNKDRQHQHLQQPLTPQMMNQPEQAPVTGGDPESMGREARIQHLEGEAHRLSQLAATMKTDLELITKAARHGAPPEGFEPKTAEGKEALEQMVLLGNVAKGQRERATTAQALPESGWASDTARQLVEAVPPHERVLLLGDLLLQLLPHTGEQGQNETASDVLKRLLAGLETLSETTVPRLEKQVLDDENERAALSERMAKVQSAMVARRAPDAEAGSLLQDIYRHIVNSGPVESVKGAPDLVRGMFPKIIDEWRGLRDFFSEAPFVSVAVRDDGHKGPIRERYSLLVLSWDGRIVDQRPIEQNRPWGDISPYLEQTVRKHLIPVAYR